MKIKNLFLITFVTLMFSGCGTFLLFTGTVIGGAYTAKDINENYNGDGVEYIKDKANSAYEAVTDN